MVLLLLLLVRPASAVTATGGNITNLGTYISHVFTNNGTFTVSGGGNIEVLVVAGGGGGGKGYYGGGGGAGGLIYSNAFSTIAGSNYAVVVGAGGAGATIDTAKGVNGVDSSFGALLVAKGGGGGGSRNGGVANGPANGADGGSGGGVGMAGSTRGIGTQPGLGGYGNDGSPTAGSQATTYGGGGGGAGSAAPDTAINSGQTYSVGGRGGDGRAYDLSGTSVYYAGGGGGGSATVGSPYGAASVAGGLGGGGRGGTSTNTGSWVTVTLPSAGTNGFGGGGGGGAAPADNGASGGSGIVIVRYFGASPIIGNQAVSDITSTSATLNGVLISTGDSPTTVSVYWGTNDGGIVAANWQYSYAFSGAHPMGSLSTNVALDVPDVTYYYRFYATNSLGECWAGTTASFAAGAVTVSATDSTATEFSNPGMFTISRPASATNEALAVAYTLGGIASNGVDYTALTGIATIPAGTTVVDVVVSPITDNLLEGSETVELNLVAGPYVIGSQNAATVTVADLVWYVSTNGLDSNGGTGWGDAYATISNGLAQATAAAGGVVLVSNGLYLVTSELRVTNGIAILGYNGDRGAVIARGAGSIRVFTVNHAIAVLDSLTISNGALPDSDGYYGGNVLMTNGTIRNCTIVKGQARVYGGGVYMVGGTITNTLVTRNFATYGYGGGVYMVNGTLASCTVSTNSVTGWGRGGGGIYMVNGSVSNCWVVGNNSLGSQPYHGGQPAYGAGVRMENGTVRDCLIERNRVYEDANGVYGAGLSMIGGTVERCILRYNRDEIAQSAGGGGAYVGGGRLANCQIYGNYSAYRGGGLYAAAGQVLNCTVVSNTAPSAQGGGIFLAGAAVTNTIAYFNTALNAADANVYKSSGVFTFSCSTPLINSATDTNNIAGDPGFRYLATNDHHFLPSSPCIDAGANLAIVTVDYEKQARPVDGNADGSAVMDMGAYEFVAAAGPLQCDFQANTNFGLGSLNVVLTATVTGGNTNGLYYLWDYQNDGIADDEGAGLSVVSPTLGVGLYTVALTVSNAAAEGASRIRVNYITVVSDNDAYVVTNGTPVYPYASWADATTNLQDAIDRIEAGLALGATARTVWVGAGRYTLGAEVTVSKAVSLVGTGGPASTVLNGNAAVRCLSLVHTNALVQGLTLSNGQGVAVASGVYMTGGLLTNSVVIGCRNYRAVYISGGRVANCEIKNNILNDGGGLRMAGGTVSECLISGNYACLSGIGVYISGGALINSTLRSNSSRDSSSGAGVYVSGGVVSNCLITANILSSGWGNSGAGAYVAGGLLTHSVIVSNQATEGYGAGRAGGVYVAGGTVRNCLIRGNKAQQYGGGGYVNSGLVENVTVVGNQVTDADGVGGGLFRAGGGITNTIVYYNASPISSNLNTATGVGYSCAPELVAGVSGNIVVAPGFESSGSGYGLTHLAGDYRLAHHSPCGNAGTNNLSWMTTAVDLTGALRIQNDIVDMGAYEVFIYPDGTVYSLR